MRLGIDFGTTNSAVACYDGQTLTRIVADSGNDNPHVLPSLIYVDRTQKAVVGTAAATEYLENETGRPVKWEKRRVGEIDVVASGVSYVQTVHIMVDTAARGRLMQYIKTALRDPAYDGTQVFDRFYTLDELIAIILRSLKGMAERALDRTSNKVVLGRPVRFAADPAMSMRAEEILAKAARLAGFDDVRFELEPIGAAYYYHRSERDRKLAFVFDFGGGTLDMTVMELGGGVRPTVLGTHGVVLGGDDLDRRIMQSLLPHFGGQSTTGKPALPLYILDALDNWQTMPILSRGDVLASLDEYLAAGVGRREISALKTLVTRNVGFKLFREIEQVKKRLSESHLARLDFEYEDIDIHEHFTRRQFESMIQKEVDLAEKGIHQALDKAGVTSSQIDVVLRTGGTSAVPIFVKLLERIFGEGKVAELDLLTSVVGGLAVVAYEGGGYKSPYDERYGVQNVPQPGSIRVKSSKPYERYAFHVGEHCYRDKPYPLLRIPVELSGLPAIRTAQEDKNAANKLFMQFQLDRAARIYVAYDAESPNIPNWLREFEPLGVRLIVDQTGTRRDFGLFARDFEPGLVSLGGNRAQGQPGEVFMNYFVIIKSRLPGEA